MLCAKVSGIAGLQTLLVAGRKYMVKGCFEVRRNNFVERSITFRRSFIRDDLTMMKRVNSKILSD